MRREERVTVQGPAKEQQPDGLSHKGALLRFECLGCPATGVVSMLTPDSHTCSLTPSPHPTARQTPFPRPFIQIYRGSTFGPLFQNYVSVKPLLVSEYGMDAYQDIISDLSTQSGLVVDDRNLEAGIEHQVMYFQLLRVCGRVLWTPPPL